MTTDELKKALGIPDTLITNEMHGSELIPVVLDKGAKMPTRNYATDAGLDLYAIEDVDVPAFGQAVIGTGVHIELPYNSAGLVKSRSSMMKKGILTDGTVDVGYSGEIKVILFNMTGNITVVHKGDKIAQLVIVNIRTPRPVAVDSIEKSDRGNKGFGSSGK